MKVNRTGFEKYQMEKTESYLILRRTRSNAVEKVDGRRKR
jgi:hypothetical protein